MKDSYSVAVCLHIWSCTDENLQEMEKYVKNIVQGCGSNLIKVKVKVTYILVTIPNACDANMINNTQTKISRGSQSESSIIQPIVKVFPVDNVGMDIGGFLISAGFLMDESFCNQPDFIIKLHTKSNLNQRKRMTDNICGNPEQVVKSVNLLIENESIGQIGSSSMTMVDPPILFDRNKYHLEDLCKLLCVDKSKTIPHYRSATFIAGTMFWYRWDLLQHLFQERLQPCVLRNLLNSSNTLDHHWYKLPKYRHWVGASQTQIKTPDESVRHFEENYNSETFPGSVIHKNMATVPWNTRYRDGQMEHAMERFFGYWVIYMGKVTKGI